MDANGLRQIWILTNSILLIVFGAAGLAGIIDPDPFVIGVLFVLVAIMAFDLGRQSIRYW